MEEVEKKFESPKCSFPKPALTNRFNEININSVDEVHQSINHIIELIEECQLSDSVKRGVNDS